ncbi:hypothetical protein Smp_189110 [Schistosoma mansoni]|nr:hypothetical protein Smp_189110 [Schistosoma mansoni]|eukprot:XP_018651319.1 hypothetical protein Smp_189110 [Schistosoma mansoni]
MHTVCVLFSMRVCQTEWETEVVWVSQTLEWRSNALTTRPS